MGSSSNGNAKGSSSTQQQEQEQEQQQKQQQRGGGEKESKESIQAKEDRLREKLKRKAEDRAKEKKSQSNKQSSQQKPKPAEDSKSTATTSTTSNSTSNKSSSGNKRRNRRRRRKRGNGHQMSTNPNNGNGPHNPPAQMMDSRSYYSQEPYGGGGGGGRYPPNGNGPHGGPYRGPPGPYYPRGGPGPGGPWERGGGGGGYNDRNGPGPGPPRHEYYDPRDDYRDRDRVERDRFGRGARYPRDRNIHVPPPTRGRGRSPSWSRSRSRSRSRSHSGSSASGYSSHSHSSHSGSGSRSRSRSFSSRSRSVSSSRSRSRSVSSRSRSRSRSISRSRSVSRGRNRSRSRSTSERRRRSRSSSSMEKEENDNDTRNDDSINKEEDESTKDQRTIVVSQLVMRAEESDLLQYFKKKGFRVKDVILLRDKRTGRHKGIAYLELGKLEHVPQALKLNSQVPDFQRFPILVKASEAEKNDVGSGGGIVGAKRVEAQKVYLGSIDRNVTQQQLFAIFSQFGELEKVLLQIDPNTSLSRGFAFLSYKDPKVANLAIQVMSGQVLAGRALRTGWANQNTTIPGLEEVTSSEFPTDSAQRVVKVNTILAQLNGTGLAALPGLSLVPNASMALAGGLSEAAVTEPTSVAEQAINAALGLPVPDTDATMESTPPKPQDPVIDPKEVTGTPSRNILVHNMFDKDEETDEGWEEDIRLDFEEEGGKHGKIVSVKVMSKELGGKIFCAFENIDGARACAENLAGRWFDKRQLKVEFVSDDVFSSAV